jgi:multidrug efflux pump subunit AcrB
VAEGPKETPTEENPETIASTEDAMKPSLGENTKGPIAWMAGHSVAANLAMLFLLIGGFIALRSIRQEVFPEFVIDAVRIQLSYPGASPEEVEKGMILVVEEAVRGLEGVFEVSSTASEGSGRVTVDLIEGADSEKVAQDIKSEIDRIRSFPVDAEDPQVAVVAHKREVMSVMVYGRLNEAGLLAVAEQVRSHFLTHEHITQVDLEGVPNLEIAIHVPQENLRRYGLTLGDIAARLRSASVDLPSGAIKTKTGEILVRLTERRDYGKEFALLPIIAAPEGSQVLLGEIADIEDGFEEAKRYTRYNGEPAVEIEVFRVGDQTPVQVGDAVRGILEKIESNLPPGIKIDIERDRSEHYRERVELLMKNGALGLVLVLALLGLFLEARLAFWVMMGIPISFMGSFLILPATNVSINMISLFAYIISLGIVVDDAVIVGENIYRYRQDGLSYLDAAIKGARQVAMPVTFSILTNIVCFLPIYFIPGTMGNIFKMIPIVVIIVFIISLVESLFILPAHLGHQKVRSRRWGPLGWLHDRQQAFSVGFRSFLKKRYGPFLGWILASRHRYFTIAIALALLGIMLSYPLSGRMGFGLFPTVESDFSQVGIVLPYGSPVEKTQAVMDRIIAGAKKVIDESGHPELVEGIITDVGRGGSHIGRTRVMLAKPDVRDDIMSTEEFTERWRKAVGEITGLETIRFASDSGGPGGRRRAISVELSHQDVGILEKASAELAERLRAFPRVKDADDGFQPGKEQLDFAIKPEGLSLGLSASSIARQVRNALYGAEVLRQQRGRNEIKIKVRLPEEERSSEQTINEFMVHTPAGTFVPLREIARVSRGRAYTVINRRNGRRVVHVSADVSPRSKIGEVLGVVGAEELPALVDKYQGLQHSFQGHRADMRESMGSLKVTFVMALLMIYVLLAIPFRSYVKPLVVMASIPFGVIGAFLGHLIMGFDLCIPSIFGIVALSGVVVNDSLVMIAFANRKESETGCSPREAIQSAAIERFRPVMLTTLTTFGGLAPMIFETSRQARFLIPMALSLGFGILFATFITLVLLPCLYVAVADVKALLSMNPAVSPHAR